MTPAPGLQGELVTERALASQPAGLGPGSLRASWWPWADRFTSRRPFPHLNWDGAGLSLLA